MAAKSRIQADSRSAGHGKRAKRPTSTPDQPNDSESTRPAGSAVSDARKTLRPTDASLARGAAADRQAAAHLRRPGAIFARIPEFATTGSALSTFAHAYLTENRLDWWHLGSKAGSGPIVRQLDVAGETASSAFQREFYSTLATVAGARLGEVGRELQFDGWNNVEPRARAIPWDTTPAPPSVNSLAGTEFYVAASPNGATTLTEVELLSPVGLLRFVAAVGPRAREAGQRVTTLSIQFVLPQRAVGLECGFLGQVDYGAETFVLLARDAAGQPIAMSEGSALDRNDWRPGQIRHIGVLDPRGRIASVELTCVDPGFGAIDQLFVTRLWYECLPPALMLQGTLCNVPPDDFVAAQHPAHPDVLAYAAETSAERRSGWGRIRQSPMQIELPYRCDSAVVLMRGFKLAHVDASATKIQRLTAHLSSWQRGSTLTIHFAGELARGNDVGGLGTGVIGAPGGGPQDAARDDTLAGAYYTVIAWESARIALHSSPAEPNFTHTGNQSTHVFELPNRHPDAHRVLGGAEERMGPLLGTVRGIRWSSDFTQELQAFSFIPGSRGGVDDGGRVEWDQSGVGLEDIVLPSIFWAAGNGLALLLYGAIPAGRIESADEVLLRVPPLSYTDFGRQVRWSYGTDLRDTAGSDIAMRTGVSGFVLNGASLEVPSNVGGFGFDTNGPHAAQRRLELDPWFAINGLDFAGDAPSVDMPIVGLGPLIFMPEDDLRELDVEVRADSFDGRHLVTFVGGGIDLKPSTGDGRFVFGLPVIGGLRRTTAQALHQVSMQDVRFRAPRGTLSLAPIEHGALRNDGNVPLLVSAMELAGSARDDYMLKIDYRGSEIAIEDVATRGPLVMNPGESLIVAGAFYARPRRAAKKASSSGSNGRANTPAARAYRMHLATLRIFTNQPGYASLDLQVSAEVVPADAAGAVMPQTINFGLFDLLIDPRQQQPRQRGLIVTSDGTTPLFISRISIVPPLPAFDYRPVDAPPQETIAPGSIHQLEPATSMLLAVYFNPDRVGLQEAQLSIETNAGPFAVALRGEGVRR